MVVSITSKRAKCVAADGLGDAAIGGLCFATGFVASTIDRPVAAPEIAPAGGFA
jgi:hypothetical protein